MSYGTVQAEKMTTESGYSLGAGNASSFKNRSINGGMVINQRGSGTLTLTGSSQYAVDQFGALKDSSAVCTAQQNTSSLPAGFTNSLLWTTTTGAASSSTHDSVVSNKIEGYNWADLNFGSANAKTFTISFWVKSSIAGTYGISLSNSAADRCYMATYTVNSANTWEQKSVTVAGDTTGTWLTTNGLGLRVFFDLGSGSSRSIAASSVWGSSYGTGLTGGVKISENTGATWNMTGFQIEVGTVATSFDQRSYGQELLLCQRYCYVDTNDGSSYKWFAQGYTTSSTSGSVGTRLPVTMRATPSGTFSSQTAFIFDTPSGATTTTALSVNSFSTPQMARITMTASGGLTSAQPIALASDGSSSPARTLIYSAEL